MSLWLFLALLFGVACVLRNARMSWAAFILLADWALCTVAANVAEDQFIWPVLAAIDYTAALLLIVIAPGRWSAALAASYVVEGMAHVAFGLSAQGDLQRYAYWYTLHYVAWGQAWLIVAWGGLSGGKKLRGYNHHRRGPAAAPMGAIHRDDGGAA